MLKKYSVQYLSPCIMVTILLFTIESCSTKEDKSDTSQVTDSIASATSVTEEEDYSEENPSVALRNIIQYHGATENEIRSSMERFSLLDQALSLAVKATGLKDSLQQANQRYELNEPGDSAIFLPDEMKAYNALLDYQKLMASGPPSKDASPALLRLVRQPQPGDSSAYFLPAAGASTFFSKGNFFFLGGAPFLYRQPEEYFDNKGNPETRFGGNITENGNFLLNSIYHFKNVPTRVTFGPALNRYDNTPVSINGVGSIIHEFVQRYPVFLLTESGIVPADLISISVKLVPQYMGCVSDQPYITFACPTSIDEKNILGIYIPYNTPSPTSCTVNRESDFVWTADLNADGIADLACVTGTFEGIASDTLFDALWFVNINGSWQIIDWGMDLDCT